jgi:CO/xanthine dehydrogenase Mo-binding subunit
VRSTFKPLGQAGATARIMLVTAAAQAWGVNADSCTASNCQVIHASTGRKFDYGKLVDAAAKLPVPKDVVLKGHADYVLLGKPRARMDGPSKVDGSAKFGIDARPPGLKFAAIAACPVFGGTLKSADEAAALKVKGMIKVVRLYNAVAVIADHTGAAKKGLAALDPQWDLGPNAAVNQAEIVAAIDAASKTPGVVAPSKTKGDADKAMVGAARKIEAVYEQPFLAHAPMEPINCTARVTEDLCEVWLGHQAPQAAEGAAAKASDLPVEKVVIHNHLIGGGFGRKVELDMVTQAVSIAKTVDYPVSLIWSREEDIQHDFYRPYYIDRLAAGLGADNKPVAWTHRITGSSVLGRFMPPVLASAKGVDFDAIEGAETPYALSNMKVEYVRHESMVPTGFWRGVGTTHNVFVVESFIDECAHAAGADPVAYRRALVTEPRTLAVLEMAAAKADWGKPLPPGWGRGISLQSAWDTHLCQVIDAEVTKTGEVKVHRVVCVVDCGQMINPETVRAQVQGGIIFGLTAALHGEITIANGRVEQANFDTYAPLRMRDAPKIEAYLIENHESPGGMGEPPTAGAAAALANAVFAATGKRVRKLPLSSAKLV